MAMMRMGGPGGPQKPVNPRTKKRIAEAFGPYKPQLLLIVLLVFLSAGLGLFAPIDSSQLDTIEAFFADRGADNCCDQQQ